MKEKPNYYAILSAEVRYDERLRPMVKLMYAEITALCNMNGKCFATNRYFSKLYNVSKGSISGYIQELVKYGYITTEYTYKEDSKEIDNRYIKIISGGVAEKGAPLYPKTEQNNTTIINTNLTDSNKKHFSVPILSDINKYCKERNNNIDPLAFYDFYTSKNWMIGKNKMKDWKAAVRTWERRDKKPTMGKVHSQLSEWQKAKNLL